jgi:transketolase
MKAPKDLEDRAINAIRFLAADAVQKANSGHPGLPMGAAAMAYTLWTRHMRFNPRNAQWPGRDRFILSGGHGSALQYALLYLTGYDLPLEQLMNFRQYGSQTPGHPEFGLTPGIEVTTGPLGQGFANGVGMAIAEAHMAAEFNRPGFEVINHFIYGIVTDGDLMEGVASEAASIAGHLRLGKIIYLYDDNRISIDGSTELAFTEDRAARFVAYGWHVQKVLDGNDTDAVYRAISRAQKDPHPSLIVCRTHIGYGLPTRQDTAKAHGEAPGEEELNGAKKNLGWPLEPKFYVPEDVLVFFRKAIGRGKRAENLWRQQLKAYLAEFPELDTELERRLMSELPANWESDLPCFPADAKGMATRAASGKVINALAQHLPDLIGGSADLTPSNDTWIKDSQDFQAVTPSGRYFHFGVREHAMGAITNGMSVYGGVIPYAGTFLIFSDYMRPAVRLSALSKYPSIWIYTHDSIGLGEDGPTHQPVEHLAALRAIPNLVVIRPADANEVTEAWKIAVSRRHGPTALILTRQVIPVLDRTIYAPSDGLKKGAYVLADLGDSKPELILMASGSEVCLITDAGARLASEGINLRLVSFPSWELFQSQDEVYRNQVLPPEIKLRLSVEAGVSQGWEKWVGDNGTYLSVERFGASAPYKVIFEHYGFTVNNVIQLAKQLLLRSKR